MAAKIPALDLSNPIAAAVHPLKADAIEAAKKFAKGTAEQMLAKLAEHEGRVNEVYPYPRSFGWSKGKGAYREAVNAHYLICRFTTPKGPHGPERDIRVRSAEGITKFVKEAGDEAALQYDGFICKLTRKIGPVTKAALSGNHVWSYSLLTVWFEDGGSQVWKTQTIINVSKLGKVFNQWPTRKVTVR